MTPTIRNRLLGNASIEEKVSSIVANEGDDDETEEDESDTEDVEADGSVSDSSPDRTGAPSMSQAAGGEDIEGVSSTSDDTDDSQSPMQGASTGPVEFEGMSGFGIDPATIEELENRPSSLDEKNAANFLIPTTNPIGRGQMEIGFAKISGTGEVDIPYESSFTGQPALVQTNFGFFNFDIPTWFGWSYDLDIDFSSWSWDFDFDININWTTIRLPSFAFLWNVNENSFTMFNAWGETWITYVAVDR